MPDGFVAGFMFEAQQLDGFLVKLPPELGEEVVLFQLVQSEES